MKTIPPGSTIGLLGGGQLGRMIAVAGASLGYRFVSLDPAEGGPASQVCGRSLTAPFGDAAAEAQLASLCDLITLEWENVPADAAERLARLKPLHPSASVLRTIQDRLVQRRFLAELGVAQTAHADASDLAAAAAVTGYPAILKTRRSGYDGKGQVRLESAADLGKAAALDGQPCILEKVAPFKKELSVVLARAEDGRTAVFPISENVHRGGILHTTLAPARIPSAVAERCVSIAQRVADRLGHVGVLAVELFWLGGFAEGDLLVNEIAPRVHNSGHYTHDACATSQFEQHVRAICGLPLGGTSHRVAAVMINILGDLWETGEPRWEVALARPDVRLHLYGKTQARPGRKMGHLVVLGDSERALAGADELLASLRR